MLDTVEENCGTQLRCVGYSRGEVLDTLLSRNVERFLVFKADRLIASLNSRLESNKEEEVQLAHLLHQYDPEPCHPPPPLVTI